MLRHISRYVCAMAALVAGVAMAGPVVSDGSDGALNPAPGNYLLTIDLPADGILNYTTINIPAGVHVKFNRNAANTAAFLAATGSVVIDGEIDVSAYSTNVIVPVPENPKNSGGPGGGDGGAGGGDVVHVGQNGGGRGGGLRGFPGGAGGNATPGLQATRYGGSPGAGGPAVSFAEPFGGGSGGAGGDAGNLFGIWLDGGYGGGGGGGLLICTPGQLTLNGTLRANGANASWGFRNVLANGAPGGGGSGGNVDLYGGSVTIAADALLEARGGYGGGLSTQPYSQDPPAYSSGANGGLGYIRINAGNSLDFQGSISGKAILFNGSLLLGDASGDGQVDGNDLIAVEENFGATGEPGIPGDANGDGQVDGNDLIAAEENFGAFAGTSATVPEPMSVLALAIGAMSVTGRWRTPNLMRE